MRPLVGFIFIYAFFALILGHNTVLVPIIVRGIQVTFTAKHQR